MTQKPKKPAPEAAAKPADVLAVELKAKLLDHLSAIASLMTDAEKHGFEISFNVSKSETGGFAPTNVGLIKRY